MTRSRVLIATGVTLEGIPPNGSDPPHPPPPRPPKGASLERPSPGTPQGLLGAPVEPHARDRLVPVPGGRGRLPRGTAAMYRTVAAALALGLVMTAAAPAQVTLSNGRTLFAPSAYSQLYVSHDYCRSLALEWQEYFRQVTTEHDACLQASQHQGRPGRTCTAQACQGLHDALHSDEGGSQVAACYSDLAAANRGQRSSTVRTYDRIAAVVDWLSGRAGGSSVAKKTRDQALDMIHERNRRTVADLEQTLSQFDQFGVEPSTPESRRAPPGATPTQRPSEVLPGQDLADNGMRETDPRRLRRIIEQYAEVARTARCGTRCDEQLRKLQRHLRDIE